MSGVWDSVHGCRKHTGIVAVISNISKFLNRLKLVPEFWCEPEAPDSHSWDSPAGSQLPEEPGFVSPFGVAAPIPLLPG